MCRALNSDAKSSTFPFDFSAKNDPKLAENGLK